MNTMIPNTFNSVEQNAAITQGLFAFQTGGPHNSSTVVNMARPWAGSGSVLLKAHSVEHHDGAAVSLTARDGVPNYHNDNTFTSTPFGRGNDKNFFSLFCERRPLIGRLRAKSRNMLRPPTKRYYHCERKVVVSDTGGRDDGMPPRKKRRVHEPPSIPSIFSCSTCGCALWELSSHPLLCQCPKPDTLVERQQLAVASNEWSTATSCRPQTAGNRRPSHSPEQRMRIAHTKLRILSSFCARFCHWRSVQSKCSVTSQLWKPLPFSFDRLQTIEEVQEQDNSNDCTRTYESTPFGRDDDRPFKSLYCQPHSRYFIGRRRKRSRNMVTPPRRQHHNYNSMLRLRKRKACATFDMPLLKRPRFCKVPDNLDVSVEQSLVEVEEAVTDDAVTTSLAPANTSVLPQDDVSEDDTELLNPGLSVAPYPSETTQRRIQWSLSHQPHSPPTGVPAPTVLRRARYTRGAIPVYKEAIEHGRRFEELFDIIENYQREMNGPWDGSTNDPYCLLRKMVKYLFVEPSLHRPETLECEVNLLERMIPGLSKGILSMFFSQLEQRKLGSKWELDGRYSSRSKRSDVTNTRNKDPVVFCTDSDVRKCNIEEETEEDIVLVTNANVTAETDFESMDAVDGSAPVPEGEEPQAAAADVTTATESQLSDVDVASDAMDFKDDCMPDAANIFVSISSEVSSTPREVLEVLPDTFVASAPMGSMWIPDLRYPTVALVRRSCRMAGRPRPNYRV